MSVAKTIGHGLGCLRALPVLACYAAGRAVMGQERAFIAHSERIARSPGMLGVYARQAFYRHTINSLGKDVYFGFMSLLSKPQAVIADGVYIGRFCTLGWVDLGQGVKLADGVQVLSGGHQHSDGMEDQGPRFEKVTIGAGAWIGAGAIVMADVGARAVVAAGAVVVKPVPEGAKVGGVPARALE